MTPTAFTNIALKIIATASAQKRAIDNPKPRLRATPSSSPSKVSGRNSSTANTPAISRRGRINCAVLQSCWFNAPVLHRNRPCS
ncbi:hypothetical protein D3C76_1691120 [compost metagenome]